MGCGNSKSADTYSPEPVAAPPSVTRPPEKINDAASQSTATGGKSPGNSEPSSAVVSSTSNNDKDNMVASTEKAVAMSPKKKGTIAPNKRAFPSSMLAQKVYEGGGGRLQRRALEEKLKKPAAEGGWMGPNGALHNYVVEGDEWQWAFQQLDGHNIRILADNTAEIIEVPTKQQAIDMVKGAPWKYFGCEFVSEGYIGDARIFTRDVRLFENGYGPNEEQPDATGVLISSYRYISELAEHKRPELPESERCLQSLRGTKFSSKLPGRSEGVMDLPWLKILPEQVNPGGFECGEVDDGWLLSALAALAEFDGAVQRLFRLTPNIEKMPTTAWNTYTIILFDLPTGRPVEVKVGESLMWHEETNQLVGVRPSKTGELWPCYVEKACAMHCGGWEAIHAGTCTHAMSLLTGKKEVYTIKRNEKGMWNCFGHWDPNQKKWEDIQNQRSVLQLLWPSKWPEVGGGGAIQEAVSDEGIFERLCAWDDADYLMCALSKDSEEDEEEEEVNRDTLGFGAEYTIVSCIDNAGGYDFDMIQLRDALGRGRHNTGDWADGGANWDRYPEVKQACMARAARGEGLFWMERKDFVENFVKLYVCAYDMANFMTEPDPAEVAIRKSEAKVEEEDENRVDAGDTFDLADLGITDEQQENAGGEKKEKKKKGTRGKKKRASKKSDEEDGAAMLTNE